MTTTDHAAEAINALCAAAQSAQPLEAYYLAEAQVHATLALVAEQRTANQLALLAWLPPHSDARDALLDDARRALLPEDVTP